jgi:hypothetical protein
MTYAGLALATHATVQPNDQLLGWQRAVQMSDDFETWNAGIPIPTQRRQLLLTDIHPRYLPPLDLLPSSPSS